MKKFLTVLLALVIAMTALTGVAFADAKEPVILTMFSSPANVGGNMADTWWGAYLNEQLGITLEMLPKSGDDEAQIQALMAADALPDIVIFKDKTTAANAIKADMLVCLDDYADVMPNAQKYMATSMKYNAENVSDDGKNYLIANNVGDPVRTGILNWSTSIRWDLYQQIGAPEIKTAWDYLDVLKQMQDIYPKNEDDQPVYAITAWADWDGFCMQNVTQLSMLSGVDSGDQLGAKIPLSCVDFSTLEISPALALDSAYVDGLKWFFTANQMGILDPDSMTQTWNTALDKGNTGRTLFSWWNWGCSGYNTPERANADDPIGFNVVLPTEGKLPLSGSNKVGSDWCWAISAKSQYIDRCIEYLEFMCTPEHLFILANGPKGVTWDMNADGYPELTELGEQIRVDSTIEMPGGGKLGDGLSLINSTPLQSGTFCEEYNGTISNSLWPTTENIISKLEQERIDVTGYEYPVDMLLDKGAYVYFPLANNLIAPLPDEMQMLATQIGDIVRTQSWLAVYAADEAEFNTLVNDMIDMANELGYADLMAYNETAWKAACDMAAQYE